jgi:hypothetical protein
LVRCWLLANHAWAHPRCCSEGEHREATCTAAGAAVGTAAPAASPLAGTLGGLLALVLEQAQQRLAAICEVPSWDASLHLAQPAGSSKQLARRYSDLKADGTLSVAADLRSALRWFFTVPAGSFDLLAVSSCRRHLRNCATCKQSNPRQWLLGCESCHTALLDACLAVWIHAKVVCMAQGPAPLDEADPSLEARPVCDLGGIFGFQPVLPASTQQPQAETAGYIQELGLESTPVVRIK